MSHVSLSGMAPPHGARPENPRLVSAAHEFEASLMKEFLKPLQQDGLFAEEGSKDEDGGGSAAALMGYGAEAMAKAISDHGGFGIAQKIIDHFQTTEVPSAKNTKSGSVHF